MKDKLRELAAKYRRHATSCGSPVYENCADDIQNILEAWGEAEGDAEEVAESLSDDAELVRRQLGPDNEVSENMERAAEILRTVTHIDAEGDGGAPMPKAFGKDGIPVWWVEVSAMYRSGLITSKEAMERATHGMKSTHPARSGVVSDEDVEAALIVYEETTHDDALKSGMRAALEHFAAIAQEK